MLTERTGRRLLAILGDTTRPLHPCKAHPRGWLRRVGSARADGTVLSARPSKIAPTRIHKAPPAADNGADNGDHGDQDTVRSSSAVDVERESTASSVAAPEPTSR
jgi:hypothetical protein